MDLNTAFVPPSQVTVRRQVSARVKAKASRFVKELSTARPPTPSRPAKRLSGGDLSGARSARVVVERGVSASVTFDLQPPLGGDTYVFQSQARLLRRLRRVDALRLLRLRDAVHGQAVARLAAHRAGEVADASARRRGRARPPPRAVPILDAPAQARPARAPIPRQALRR